MSLTVIEDGRRFKIPPAEEARGGKAVKQWIEAEKQEPGSGSKSGVSLKGMTMPQLKAMAKELGIDVDKIEGSGKGGNLLVADVRAAIEAQASEEADKPTSTGSDA